MQLENLSREDWESVLGSYDIVGTGGGCKGALSIGYLLPFYSAIMHKGLWPSVMWAVSANALTLADVIASGDILGSLNTWTELGQRGQNFLFDRRRAIWNVLTSMFVKRNAVYGDRGLRWLVDKIDVRSLIASPIELRFVVYHESSKKGEEYQVISSHADRFKKDPELLRSFLLASASFAGFLPPVIILGHTYSDGLCPPLKEAIKEVAERGGKTTFLFINDLYLPENHATASYGQRMFYSSDFKSGRILCQEIELAVREYGYRVINANSPLPIVGKIRKIRDKWSGRILEDAPDRALVIIAAKKPIQHLTTDGFAEGKIAEAIEHGKECMREALEALVKFRRPDLAQ